MSNDKIKIFVSHRKDLTSAIIDNPLYCHVICGAALGKPQNGKIGDNIGDNISEKQPYYSEFTVQYWAWKNCKADYYGLCHYRRYLSFADKMFPEWNEQRFAAEPNISSKTTKKYGLLNPSKMAKEIKNYDVITSVTYETKNIPNTPTFKNVYEAFVYSPGLFTTADTIEKLKILVKHKFPEYYDSVIDELNSPLHRGFNCFVMRKELFFKMCEFQFGVLFELEKQLDLPNRVGNYKRELGYMGEILYGSFIRWVNNQKCYKVKETQIVLFLNTNKINKPTTLGSLFTTVKNILIPDHKRIKKMHLEMQEQNQRISLLLSEIKTLSKNIEHLKAQNSKLFFSQNREFPTDLAQRQLTFWRSYPKATGDLRTIQLAQFMLLQNFNTLCQKLNIKFWLHGGSLIGGVRHSGFVPWDDDIDIAMMREDFIKIKDYLEQNSQYYEIKEYYYIQLGCRAYRFRRKDLNSGVFVDIFIFDNYSIKYENILDDWKNLCSQKLRIRSQSLALCHELGASPKEPTLKGFDNLKSGLDTIYNNYINTNKSNADSEFIAWGLDNNYKDEKAFAWQHGRIFNKKDIFPLKSCSFEGMECYIPADFKKYVYAEYGISYLDMPKNFGNSIHWQEFFSGSNEIELAQKIIDDGILEG